jgi:beta-fructofuranosidase
MITRRHFMVQSGWLATASLLAHANRLPEELAQENNSLQHRMIADPLRPQFHFLPPANWMNDPNGPIYWKGYYHLFYQYNPNGAYWGDMHWGHARSKDMLHWKHLPVALAPTPAGPDKDGCFSGSAFINNGTPTLVYTGVNPEVQCLATSDDRLIDWKKSDKNPVIASPPPGMKVNAFRDPSIWHESDLWLMSVGTGFQGQGGAVLIYSSQDLTKWDYRSILFAGPPFELPVEPPVQPPSEPNDAAQAQPPKYDSVAAGETWECPDFFPLGEKHCLLVSTQGRVHYFTGAYADQKFQSEASGLADGSSLYYAAKSFVDSQGRRILWGWIREGRNDAAQRASGWAGVMSLPRVLSMDSQGTLCIEPLPELAMLRGKHHRIAAARLSGYLPVSGFRADSLEIRLELDPGDAREVGITVRRSPDAAEETTITYDGASRNIVLDTGRSSLNSDANRSIYKSPLELRSGELLRLTVFVDASVVEIFANGRACLTGRIYPTRHDSQEIGLFSNGGQAKLKSMDAFQIKAISRNRLSA